MYNNYATKVVTPIWRQLNFAGFIFCPSRHMSRSIQSYFSDQWSLSTCCSTASRDLLYPRAIATSFPLNQISSPLLTMLNSGSPKLNLLNILMYYTVCFIQVNPSTRCVVPINLPIHYKGANFSDHIEDTKVRRVGVVANKPAAQPPGLLCYQARARSDRWYWPNYKWRSRILSTLRRLTGGTSSTVRPNKKNTWLASHSQRLSEAGGRFFFFFNCFFFGGWGQWVVPSMMTFPERSSISIYIIV